MTEPIARVAAAIGDTINKGTAQDVLERAASAALAAVREPSDAMIAAGRNASGLSAAWLSGIWRAMHDGMMKE